MSSAEQFVVTDHLRQGFELYDPMSYLVESSTPTEIEDVFQLIEPKEMDYNKPVVFIVIGPSGAGKDTLVDHLVAQGLLRKLTTATSRPRRVAENEPEDSYVWMRAKRDDETETEYFNNLIQEYDLIEHDGHNGRLYGLPKRSLESQSKKPAVIRTENAGLETIMKELGDDYNIISIFVIPDSFDVLLNRIKTRENVELRMVKAVKEVEQARHLVNYVVLNRDEPEENGLPLEQKAAKAKMAIHKLVVNVAGPFLEV